MWNFHLLPLREIYEVQGILLYSQPAALVSYPRQMEQLHCISLTLIHYSLDIPPIRETKNQSVINMLLLIVVIAMGHADSTVGLGVER